MKPGEVQRPARAHLRADNDAGGGNDRGACKLQREGWAEGWRKRSEQHDTKKAAWHGEGHPEEPAGDEPGRKRGDCPSAAPAPARLGVVGAMGSVPRASHDEPREMHEAGLDAPGVLHPTPFGAPIAVAPSSAPGLKVKLCSNAPASPASSTLGNARSSVSVGLTEAHSPRPAVRSHVVAWPRPVPVSSWRRRSGLRDGQRREPTGVWPPGAPAM